MTTSQNISANQAEHTKMQTAWVRRTNTFKIFEKMHHIESSHPVLSHNHPQLLNRVNCVPVYKLILRPAFR